MSDWDYGREHGVWGNDGIPYGTDDDGPKNRSRDRDRNVPEKSVGQSEEEKYVELMRKTGIRTIVSMNSYISKHKLWGMFSSIRRVNTYASGRTSIGISKEAYKKIQSLYKTNDIIITHLVSQKTIRDETRR